MVWTKQMVGIAAAAAVFSLMLGGAAGFILGSRHQAHSVEKPPAARPDAVASGSDIDSDEEQSPASVSVNGRHAGTRFLAAKRDSAEVDTQKKDVPVAVNTATNTNTTVVAAETGSGTSRRRSRRTP